MCGGAAARTEHPVLSSVGCRASIERILFHWCRTRNHAETAAQSYRQGMNELAAVVLLATIQGEYCDADDHQDGTVADMRAALSDLPWNMQMLHFTIVITLLFRSNCM